MQQWSVGGAVIEAAALGAAGAGVLLVQNQRRGGHLDWTPPGGVIDPGESVLGGLTREVREETGLQVLRWNGPLYEIRAVAPGLGWTLRVEVHHAVEVGGELCCGEDPDGIVVAADLVDRTDCAERLRHAHRWVGEPLLEWLDQRWVGTRTFHYRVEGSDPRDLEIHRTDHGA